MERLVKPVSDGGAPYINQDFFQYLQQNHITSYGAFLEEINDVKTGNCGIIIKGFTQSNTIETVEIPPRGTFTLSRSRFYIKDSLVYLDGDFLEPGPWLGTFSEITSESPEDPNNQFSIGTFFIVKAKPSKIRRYNKVNDELRDVIELNYFDIVLSPPDGSKFIKLTKLVSLWELGINADYQNQSHLKFLQDKFPVLGSVNDSKSWFKPETDRYLSRVLRYYMADEDELYMTYDIRFFDEFGIGFGEMLGFRLINYLPSESKYLLYNDEQGGLIGKYTTGFATNSNTSPKNIVISSDFLGSQGINVATYENYGKLGNSGGLGQVKLTSLNLPPHKHGTNDSSGPPDNDMSHTHFVPVSNELKLPDTFNPNGLALNTFWQNPVFPDLDSIRDKMRLAKSVKIARELRTTGGVVRPGNGAFAFQLVIPRSGELYKVRSDGKPELPNYENVSDVVKDHTHQTSSDLKNGLTSQQDPPHENLPPTYNVYYYIKYNPYA
jgi:hypothetical protein